MTGDEPTAASPRTDRPTAANPYDLHTALHGVDVPVTTRDLRAAAAARHAGPAVVETLARLPERTWDSVDSAVAAATMGWSAADQTGGRMVDGQAHQPQRDALG